jgi:hypothetical protein
MTYNTYDKDRKTHGNHSSLNRNCPSLQAMLLNTRRIQTTKMPQIDNSRKRITQGHRNIKLQAPIRCMHINLQHSRVATDNIMKLIEHDNSDMIFIQEPYLHQNRMAGLIKSHRNYISHEDKCRAAIIITNNKIDAILIKQRSNSDSVLVELRYNNTRFFTVGTYFDIMKEIERELNKIEEILEFTKGNGLVIAVNSNSRSMAWHASQTNQRGKIMEEYILSKNVYIMNEESELSTFQNRRGSSNIDLTIVNNQLLKELKKWEISEEESCSDHNIIKFGLRQVIYHDNEYDYNGHRYIVTDVNLKKFDNNLSRIVAMKYRTEQDDSAKLDGDLASKVKKLNDIESTVDLFQEALILSCNKSFKITKIS